MSVLKYNNNGTWEGLNIDHASTADSALYDADGNVISSTYLPLSAGSDAPLTNSLYINNASGGGYNISVGNTNKAQFVYTASGTPRLDIWNPTSRTGVSFQDSGNTYLTANGNIYLRPNDASGSSGQVYLKTDGQMCGGRPLIAQSSGTISYTVTPSSGYYPTTIAMPSGCTHCLQTFQASFVSSTAQIVTVVVNGSSTQSYFPASANTRYLSVSGLYAGTAACSIKPESANITCTSWVFRTIWF